MLSYILVVLSAVLLAANIGFTKQYQDKAGVSLAAGLHYNIIIGIVTFLLFWIFNGFKMYWSTYSFIMAFIISFLGVVYTILGFTILKQGGMAIYTLFLMTGGMILPYIWGIIFLDEAVTLLRIIGLIAIMAAILISNRGKITATKTQLLLCFIIFIMNGFVSIVSKMHQINEVYEIAGTTDFVIYTGIGKFVFSYIAMLFIPKAEKKQLPKLKMVVPIISASAILSGVSYVFQLIGASNLPATVLYPIITGGSIIFSALAGKLFFKEYLSVNQWASIIICFIGTCMFL